MKDLKELKNNEHMKTKTKVHLMFCGFIGWIIGEICVMLMDLFNLI